MVLPEFLPKSEVKEYLLKMDWAEPMVLGIEAIIAVTVDGETFEACVPSWALIDPELKTVPCSFVGTIGDRQLLVFPPSSLDTAIWKMRPESVAKIRVDE